MPPSPTLPPPGGEGSELSRIRKCHDLGGTRVAGATEYRPQTGQIGPGGILRLFLTALPDFRPQDRWRREVRSGGARETSATRKRDPKKNRDPRGGCPHARLFSALPSGSYPGWRLPVADLIRQASDDQLALLICLGAVSFCGLTMYFSHHVGRLTGHIRLHDAPENTELPAQPDQVVSPIVLEQPVRREKAA